MKKKHVEHVQELFAALQQNDMEVAASILDDGFELIGWAPRAITKNQFLALHSELLDAMPDLSYHLYLQDVELRDDDETVEALIQLTGTQTDELSLPLFGVRALPATGNAVVLPQTPIHAEVLNERITRLETSVIPGGGMTGLLQQLDTELPLTLREEE